MIVLGQHHPPIAVADGLAEPGGRGSVGWYSLPSESYVAISQTITPLETSAETAWNFFATSQQLTVPGTNRYVIPTSCYKNDGSPTQCGATGFYFGVQPSGVLEDERSEGPVALFSSNNTTAAVPGPEAMCRRFDWESAGHLCRVNLPSIAGENNFRIERLSDGKSWRGTIRQSAGPEITIGVITHTDVFEAFAPLSWLEAYGKPTLCGSIPNGWARFSAPEITRGDGTVRRMQVYATNTFHCPTSKSLVYDTCDAVFLGEGRPLRNPPTDVHEFVNTREPDGWRYQAPTLLSARALGNSRFSVKVTTCNPNREPRPTVIMSSAPLENGRANKGTTLAQTAPYGTDQEHFFDASMESLVADGDGKVCFAPFSYGKYGASTCIPVADIVARASVIQTPTTTVPKRITGTRCTSPGAVRRTSDLRYVCTKVGRGLVWRQLR